MHPVIKIILFCIVAMLSWSYLNLTAALQGWFVQSPVAQNDLAGFSTFAKDKIQTESNGNVSMILIKNGEIVEDYQYSVSGELDENSIFGVSSVSKWITAVAVMRLVEEGKLSLDQPVSHYLTRWQLPPNQFDNDGVTVRRLLSHTAGITDGLGHNGFKRKEDVQALESHLSNALDADEGVNGKVLVGREPGSGWQYSGGSYNLLQLLIEEVSGQTYANYIKQTIFTPLDMQNSGYDADLLQPRLAPYFDNKGKVLDYPYYTSLAATGLYTSASDLAKFVISQSKVSPNSASVITPHTLAQMLLPQASNLGLDIWGLGPMLFAPNNQGSFVIGHGGQSPHLNASARVNPDTGNGIVILSTGNRALAADLATYWTLAETGNPDMYMLKNLLPESINRIAMGNLFILLLAITYGIVTRRRKTRARES